MNDATRNRIAGLLGEQMGYDIRSVSSAAIGRAVRNRMTVLKIQDAEEYEQRLSTCVSELQELIELLVVPETWFFRYPRSFTALTDFVRRKWLPSHPAHTLRVLSIPCSTGEEPYSIAVALLDIGLSPGCFQIDAVDISVRLLSRAECAVYQKNSFRNHCNGFRDRYFSTTAGGYRLAERVRATVTFRHDNLLRPSTLLSAKRYDIVFCRNVLIYFNPAAQLQAISNLRQLLKFDGLLFSGPAEGALFSRHGFKSEAYPEAFAFKKVDGRQVELKKVDSGLSDSFSPERVRRQRTGAPDRRNSAPRQLKNTRREALQSTPATPRAQHSASSADNKLAEALRLADEGRLSESAALCEAHLSQERNSATAYYVLGLIYDAQGDPRAVTCYRKALYLDPQHIEALAHLALLMEKQGDAAGAMRLRTRAHRLERQLKRT